MTFKKMKKVASRSGFTLSEDDDRFRLTDRKSGANHVYSSLAQLEPDIEELRQGYAPF